MREITMDTQNKTQREIKFRAWHKEKRKMFPVTTIQFPTTFNPGYAGTLKEDGFDTLYPFEEAVILMQYTGLKDKNGKEIYEGDVVELRQETPKGSEGLMVTIVKWSEDGLNFNVYPCHDEKYWKVIGNVWEHPDLQEAGK